MKRIAHITLCLGMLSLGGFESAAGVQNERAFQDPEGRYALTLPAGWEPVVNKDGAGNTVVMIIFENQEQGLLRIHRRHSDQDTSPQALADQEKNGSIRFRPGYTNSRIDPFNTANYEGVVLSFDFTRGGRPKIARYHYLKIDEHTFYVLQFDGTPQVLRTMQNRTDLMVRSFRVLR